MKQSSAEFVAAVHGRIILIRSTFRVKPMELYGIRFKDDDLIYSAVVGALLTWTNNKLGGSKNLYSLVQGLDFDPKMVATGRFDLLIESLLSEAARMDYFFHNSRKHH